MPKPDYDTTIARMASNIAAGIALGDENANIFDMAESVAKKSVLIARKIVEEVRRTEEKGVY